MHCAAGASGLRKKREEALLSYSAMSVKQATGRMCGNELRICIHKQKSVLCAGCPFDFVSYSAPRLVYVLVFLFPELR